MTKDEALTLALEALEDMHIIDFPLEDLRNWNKAITAIKEALAQPTSGDYALGYAEGFNDACKRQPERTGWPAGLLQDDDRKLSKWLASRPDAKHVVDMAQPERIWVGLTKEEIDSALSKYASWYDFAAHLENILKEKNQ